MSARRRAKVVPLPTPAAPGAMRRQVSPALIEEMFKAACMLQIALRGLMEEASDVGCNLDRDDFYPFWELSLGLVRDLRLLHHGGRA